MTKKLAVISSLLTLTALVCGLIWISTSSFVQGQSQPELDRSDMFSRINDKARRAKNGDYAAIEELTDGLLNSFAAGELPDWIKQGFKTRIAQSEFNYRQGIKQGIPEKNVADTVNELADKLGTPAYTKTHVGEVRRLRFFIAPFVRDLVGDGTLDMDKAMSPAEAVYITLFLIDRKRVSPDYQLTVDEWETKQKKDRADKAKKARKKELQTSPQTEPIASARTVTKTQRQLEVEAALNTARRNKSSGELLEMARKSLDTLGIN